MLVSDLIRALIGFFIVCLILYPISLIKNENLQLSIESLFWLLFTCMAFRLPDDFPIKIYLIVMFFIGAIYHISRAIILRFIK